MLVAILVLCIAGCPSGKRKTPSTPAVPTSGDEDARERFEDARVSFERDEARAIAEFESIAEEYPDDPIVPWALLYAGMSAVQSGQYEQAIGSLTELEDLDDLDERLRRRGRLFLGLALSYTGQHDKARPLLERGRKAIDGDDERGEWLAAMAAVLGQSESPLAAIPYYDDWYALATRAEKAYIVARLQALAGTADADAALAAYEAIDDSDTPAAVILGLRVARDLAARGDTARAQDIREEIAEARETLSLGDGPGPAARSNPDTLGAILPLTGRRARAGDLAMRGLALASGTFEDARGSDMKPFQVVVRDSASNPAGARAAVDAAAGQGAIAMIGPIDPKSVEAAATQAQTAGVPLISLTPRSDRLAGAASPYVFHVVQSAEERARALARYAYDNDLSTFAVLRPKSGYGKAVAAAFRAEVERLGGEIAIEEVYERTATSFGDPIKAVAKKRPDAVFVPDQAERLELIAPALAAADLVSRPIDSRRKVRRGHKIALLSTAEFVAPRYLRNAGRYSLGAVLAPGFYPDRSDALIGDFSARYEQSYGRMPTALDAYAYDAALMVRTAVESGARTRAQLVDVMAAGKVTGLTGTLTFDESRRRNDAGLLFAVERDGTSYVIKAMRDR